MAYRDFKMDDLEKKFGIQEIGTSFLNVLTIKRIEPTDKLKSDILEARLITLSTEKAVSERLVTPVLAEMKKLNDEFLQVFSGEIIQGDKAQGLNGEIDFIMSKTPETSKPKNPIFCITEAKLGLVESAYPQATAQMLGIRAFNKSRGREIPIVHGAATDGKTWRFLKLDGTTIYIDKTEFSSLDLPLLLGALQEIVDFYINTKKVQASRN